VSSPTPASAPAPRNGAARVESLLQILVCPNCRSRLVVDVSASELLCTNPDCALAYPVTPDGIPVLLIDEARPTRDQPPVPTP
jgi:uncharacterized protein YbaR (Trm112 family)